MSDTDAATTEAAAQAESYRKALEGLRTRTDTTAKALAGLGTAGLTAIGIEKVTDVFPYPDGNGLLVGVALVAFLALVVVVVVFTVRLARASAPLKTSSDPERMTEDAEERMLLEGVYDGTAELNGAKSLLDYENRAHEMGDSADRTNDEPERKRLQEQAARIRAEVRATQASGAYEIISGRLTRAVSDDKTKVLGLTFVAALLAFGLSVDRLDSERTAEAAAFKGCADSIEAKVPASALPDFCDVVAPESVKEQTPNQKAASRLLELATLYETCVDSATENEQPLATCTSLRTGLRTAAE